MVASDDVIGPPITQEQAIAALADRERSLLNLDKYECELSLRAYVRRFWSVLEPGRDLAWGWALDAICEHLEAVTRGEIRKLLINVPPGMMKSLLTNVFWSSWEWGPQNLPQKRYVSAAYAQDLTVRDNRRCRTLMESPAYRAMWGDRFSLIEDQNAKTLYANDKTGFRLATSTKGIGTGERGDRVVIDDPHNVKGAESPVQREETLGWFSETMPTRATDPKTAAFVVIMQRLHERDVSGHILENGLGYVHLCLPMEYEPERRCYTVIKPAWLGENAKPEPVAMTTALRRYVSPSTMVEIANELGSDALREEIGLPSRSVKVEVDLTDVREAANVKWEQLFPQDPRWEEGELLLPDRFPADEVEDLKKQLRSWGGTYAEAGQLQQRPSPRGGGMFKRDDLHIVPNGPPEGVVRVRAWDLAGSKSNRAAYTSGVRMCRWRGKIYIENVVRFRGSSGEVERRILATATNDGKRVRIDLPQDPGQAGLAQKRHLVGMLEGYDVRATPETGSKEDRAIPLASQAEGGNVCLVDGPWVQAFITEAESFPKGRYKDQLDAASRAYARLLVLGDGNPVENMEGPKLMVPDAGPANDGNYYGASDRSRGSYGYDGYWYDDPYYS